MHDVVFRLAVAVIIASAVFFLLFSVFGSLQDSTEKTVGNTELARGRVLNKSIALLQQ